MIRLEKHKILDRITDENERKKLVNEIKASGPTLRLIEEIIDDKIDHLESQYISHISDPYLLSACVKTVFELKQLTYWFKETTNDNT